MAVRVRTIVRQRVGDDLPEVTERQEEQHACTVGLHPCSKTSHSSPYFYKRIIVHVYLRSLCLNIVESTHFTCNTHATFSNM